MDFKSVLTFTELHNYISFNRISTMAFLNPASSHEFVDDEVPLLFALF
jgi:hypothetical protein